MKAIRLIVINLIVLFVSLLVLELVLWTFSPIVADGTAITKTYKQHVHGVKKVVTYQRNEFGLRSLSMTQYEKSEDLIRVFCTGASTTQQINQETQDTWCGLLEIKLNETFTDSGFRFQTASYGGGGLRAINNAEYIKDHINKIDPDIVVTLLGVNDLALNGGPDYAPEIAAEKLVKSNWTMKKILHNYSQLRRRWHLMKLNRSLKSGKVVKDFYDELPSLRANYQGLSLVGSVNRDPDPIDEFSSAVSWIAKFVTDRDISLVLLGQPVLWDEAMTQEAESLLWFQVATPVGRVRPEGAWLLNEMGRYNNVQQQQAREYDSVFYVDLDAVIPKDADHFFDDCHFTDLGSARVASEALPMIISVAEAVIAKKRQD